MKAAIALACGTAAALICASTVFAHGRVHVAAHAPAHAGRPAIPPPVFLPAVVIFNPFIPAFVAASPVVVYDGTLPPQAQPHVGMPSLPPPMASQPPAGPRTPGTGKWLVGQMPTQPAAPAPRTHAGEPVLEIRRTSR